jgi:hypothetical protein
VDSIDLLAQRGIRAEHKDAGYLGGEEEEGNIVVVVVVVVGEIEEEAEIAGDFAAGTGKKIAGWYFVVETSQCPVLVLEFGSP